MDVFIKHFREKKVSIIGVQPDSTVLDLKNALAEKYDVSVDRIKLIFNSCILKDDSQLVISIDFEEKSPITCFIKPTTSQNKKEQISQPSSQQQQQQSLSSPHSSQPQLNIMNEEIESTAHQTLTPPNQEVVLSTPYQQLDDQTSKIEEDAIKGYNVLMSDPINSLCNMGFSRDDVEKALQLCQNKSLWAQELLLSGDVSEQGLKKLFTKFYGSGTSQVIGRKGDKYIVMTTFTNQSQRDDSEIQEMMKSYYQIYEEMDEADKQNVNILKDMGFHIVDAIYIYIECQYNLDAARQYLQNLRQYQTTMKISFC